jgi:hypothetical protein
MSDTRDTDPEIPIPDEAPTRPDLRVGTLQICPRCKGDGRVLEASEWATQHKAIARVCTLCEGRKSVTPRQLAEHHARSQGRPPTSGGS